MIGRACVAEVMNNEHYLHLQTLLQTYQRRLRLLEQQVAIFGPRTPPEVRIEMADVEAEIARIMAELRADPACSSSLQQLWRKALTAFFAQQWAEAEALLAEVQALQPGYEDVEVRLTEACRQRRFHDFYSYICDMRDHGAWLVVLNALAELEQQFPDFPDPEGLRQWAERRRRRALDTKLCPACGEVNSASFALCLYCGRKIV